jgi:hypothetical protein
MKYLIFPAVLYFAIASCSGETSEGVVHMKPFRVVSGYLDVHYQYRNDTDKMVKVDVTWVCPALGKQGLRVGDRLSTIDGMNVIGMPKAKFLPLFDIGMPIGAKRVFVFVRKGFFQGKAITVTFTHNGP